MKSIWFYISIFVTTSTVFAQDTDKEYVRNEKQLVERYEKIKRATDSINQVLEWKPVRDGLYESKNGDLGFKGESLIIAPDGFITIYQTTFDNEITLKSVVDIKSFTYLGGGRFGACYKDKNNIYKAFVTSDGPNFYVLHEADHATFQMLNDCYAKDKNFVYSSRFGVINGADPKTFKFLKNECYAKDKNGYYNYYRLMLDEDMQSDKKFLSLKKRLDTL